MMKQSRSTAFVATLFLLGLSLLLMASTIQTAGVQASPETVVAVEPSTISVNMSETFTVNLTVTDVQNLYSVEVTLNWNSSILELEKIDVRVGQADGVLYNPIYVVENITQASKYTLSILSLAADSFNGTGNIVRLTFSAMGVGESRLDLESQLYDRPPPDSPSVPIDHMTIGGYCSVAANALPEVPSGGVLIAVFILVTLMVFIVKRAGRKPRSTHGFSPSVHVQGLLAVNMLLRERSET